MKQRRWLITGASSGLGKALVEEVIQNGERVVASFRKPEDLEHFYENYGREQHRGILLDLSQPDSLAESLNQQLANMQIDVLVNNAGIGFVGAVEETSLEEFRHVIEINVLGTFAVTSAILPQMRARNKGRIIQISSHAGIKAFAGFGIYNASKFALEGLAEAQAQELKELGILVSLVEPGPFRTNFAGSSLKEASKRMDHYEKTAGAFRDKLQLVDGRQEGDPKKAAEAIYRLSLEDSPGLRMPLGRIALGTIQSKIDLLQEDLNRYKSWAEKAVFE